ncbi:MAG: alpha/beta hydrolase family protein [Blastocatellia bacterium]
MNHRAKKPFLITCLFAVAVAYAATMQSQDSRGILTRAAPPADHRIAYGKDEFQFGELRLPKGAGPHPVAVVIHGGCWLAQYGLSYMGHLSADLTEAGIATWSIEYRRIGNAGGGWPGTFEDVARATDYLRDLAKKYPLDLNRVVAMGHSAGGHLALWLAARKNLPKGSPVYFAAPLPLRGVVSLAGITDLHKTGTACDKEVTQLMNGSASYNQASPIELLPLKIRYSIVQGDADPIIPAAMATEFAEAAKKKGDEAQLVLIEKAGHFEVVDPKSFAWPVVKKELLMLLKADGQAKQ